jgi:hypothetical protein
MRKALMAVAGTVVLVPAIVAGVALAGGGQNDASARLDGYQETPAVSTEATGRFTADVGSDSIEYRLAFSGLSSDVLFAHIHFGRRATAGGVSAFLCGGGTAPVCPQSGSVEGVITPADVIGPEGQGIAPEEFEELVAAMEHNATYANVHSVTFPAGEIRGQIHLS